MRRRDFVALLGRVGTCVFLPPPVPCETLPLARLPAPRLDTHLHVFGPACVRRLRSLVNDREIKAAIATVEAGALIEEMNRTGVRRGLLLSVACLNASDEPFWPSRTQSDEQRDVRDENDYTAAQAATAPHRMLAFASVNPKREYAIEELTRCLDRRGMRGLVVHFGSCDVRLSEPHHLRQVRALFACAAQRNVPVIAEIRNPAVEELRERAIEILVADVIATLPRLRIVISHLGSAGAERHPHQSFAALVAAVERYPAVRRRVWVDCSAVFMDMAFPSAAATTDARLSQLVALLRAWPGDRLLWGSDNVPDALAQARRLWPLGDAAWQAMANADVAELWR